MTSCRIEASFEGPDTQSEGVPVDLMLSVLGHFQAALRLLMESDSGQGAGQNHAGDEDRPHACLTLTGTRAGSGVVEMKLAYHSGESSADLCSDALENLIENLETPDRLPDGAAGEVKAILEALDERVTHVRFTGGVQNRIRTLRRSEPRKAPINLDDDSFWRPKSVAELAEEQGTKPFRYVPKNWSDEDKKALAEFHEALLENRKH